MDLSIKQKVINYFESQNFIVDKIEDAINNQNSPFYKDWNFAPGTGFGHDLFRHKFYKVVLKDQNDLESTKWVDCLYLIRYEWWFVVLENDGREEVKNL